MKYEELSYRRMLQIVQSSRIARIAAVYSGEPYAVPVCVRCRMDGCIPVFEVRVGNDGDLLTALASNAAVLLEFEASGRGGTVETVLVRGRAAVEQNIPSCLCGQTRRQEYPDGKPARRMAEELWQQNGRVRFDAWQEPAGESGPCTRQGSCQKSCGCAEGCGIRQRCTCADAQPSCAAVITVTAAEMTGRSYAACVTRCTDMDWEG